MDKPKLSNESWAAALEEAREDIAAGRTADLDTFLDELDREDAAEGESEQNSAVTAPPR